MATMILDRDLQRRLLAERSATGGDRYDEVWEGIYIVAPMPNDDHLRLVAAFAAIFQDVIGWSERGEVRPGVNVSDRCEDWQQNYRVPDVAVFLKGGRAENRDAYWFGGPDFVVEIISPEDQTRQKLAFYERVSLRELLLVDRDPWALELLRLTEGRLVLVGRSDAERGELLGSVVLPLTFQLMPGDFRPRIQVTCTETGKLWSL